MNEPKPLNIGHGPQRFFIDPQAFILLVESEPGQYQYVTESWDDNEALLCFLSPMDAHIEGTFRARPGLEYTIMSTWSLPERLFLGSNGLLAVILHLAWSAHEGRLLLGPDGLPRRYCGPLLKWANEERPITFEVGASALGTLDRMYDRAGLFAWRETFESLWTRAIEDQHKVATQAVRAARVVTPQDDGAATLAALFDAEFRQWHFIPRAFADDQQLND
jgi:hypothetical protein